MAGSQIVVSRVALCGAGTSRFTPLTVDLGMPPRIVHHIRIRVPSGPNGAMGFAIASNSVPLIPTQGEDFLIAADEIFDYDNLGWPDSGAWQAIMFNEGIYDHSIYIDFTTEVPNVPGPQSASTPLIIPTPPQLPTTAAAAPFTPPKPPALV